MRATRAMLSSSSVIGVSASPRRASVTFASFGVQLQRGFMDARCNDPLSWETLVAYWSGELGPEEEQQADLHLLGCATCTAESKRVASMISAIRAPRPAL